MAIRSDEELDWLSSSDESEDTDSKWASSDEDLDATDCQLIKSIIEAIVQQIQTDPSNKSNIVIQTDANDESSSLDSG